MLRIAILDDYQPVARGMADWSRIGPDVEIVSFDYHLSEDEAPVELPNVCPRFVERALGRDGLSGGDGSQHPDLRMLLREKNVVRTGTTPADL